jgi:hypothetical protein
MWTGNYALWNPNYILNSRYNQMGQCSKKRVGCSCRENGGQPSREDRQRQSCTGSAQSRRAEETEAKSRRSSLALNSGRTGVNLQRRLKRRRRRRRNPDDHPDSFQVTVLVSWTWWILKTCTKGRQFIPSQAVWFVSMIVLGVAKMQCTVSPLEFCYECVSVVWTGLTAVAPCYLAAAPLNIEL